MSALVLAAMAALTPAADAAITPTLTLDQSAGTTAGSTLNLGLDLKFAPTGTDSPNLMTLNLPPGLLANASIDGGACLTMIDLDDAACQVGTGTVTAEANSSVPITTPVTFDLVPPPAPGDLAGLAVNSSGTQIGATADIKVRPSGDPNGVGITISFVLPNSLDGVPISLTEINSTFDGLRFPATCPSTPADVSVAVNSDSVSTIQTVTAPLPVSGCAALPYAPKFAVSATQDKADSQVRLVTDITQAADEAPNRSVSLAFPSALVPNVSAAAGLCANPAAGTCTPVGSATATSPLYPAALSGKAYLTGSLAAGLSLTLVFPSPFPLTLTGQVNLATNTTAFTGLPDIPLTDLNVTLDGGAGGLFMSTCKPPSGIATAMLGDQNGDHTASPTAPFTVADCTVTSSAGGGSPSTGSTGSTAGPKLGTAGVSGLRTGRAGLTFTVAEGKGAAKLRSLTVELPAGLSVRRHRVGKQLKITGVTLTGATIKSLTVSRGHLVITLRTPVTTVAVRLKAGAVSESAGLKAKAKAGKVKRLRLTVIAARVKGKSTTNSVQITKLGL
jgi:hypothetical protein